MQHCVGERLAGKGASPMKIEDVTNRPASDRWAAYADYRRSLQDRAPGEPDDAAGGTPETPATKRVKGAENCQTCQERRYQDGSDDPGVSFKTPTRLSPDQAASAVRSHEMEHVSREGSKASRENREVVSQTVTYHNAICPECGRTYVSGGTTRTVTKGQEETGPKPPAQKGFEAFV